VQRLFVTGHFGYWELQAMVHASAPPDGRRRARARQPGTQCAAQRIRTRTGNSVIYRRALAIYARCRQARASAS
jgi:lauroyl/myristoyl acyltransferase